MTPLAALALTTAMATGSTELPCFPITPGPQWLPGHGLTPLGGGGWSGSLGPYATAGFILGTTHPRCTRCGNDRETAGLRVDVGGGWRGARLAAGYARRNPTLFGYGALMAMEHHWTAWDAAEAGDTFAGPEVLVQLGRIDVVTGVQWRISGPGERTARWSWGAQFLFDG